MYSLIPIIIQCSTYYHNIAEEKERREQEKEKVRAAKKEEANNLDMNVRPTHQNIQS